MLCKKCGLHTPDDSIFCTRCGASVVNKAKKQIKAFDFTDMITTNIVNSIKLAKDPSIFNTICSQPNDESIKKQYESELFILFVVSSLAILVNEHTSKVHLFTMSFSLDYVKYTIDDINDTSKPASIAVFLQRFQEYGEILADPQKEGCDEYSVIIDCVRYFMKCMNSASRRPNAEIIVEKGLGVIGAIFRDIMISTSELCDEYEIIFPE